MELLVAANERLLNRKPGGFTSRRRLGALCALAVQESAQSEKGVYLGRAGMDRFSTAVTRSPLSSAASVVQKAVNCVTPLCHDDRQYRFPLRSRPLPRGSNNVVSSWLCGEKSITGTQPLVDNLYQVPMAIGMDSVAGLYYACNRNYSPSLGRWISQDPAGYINGANTYQFVESNPVGNVDPWGAVTFPNNFTSGAGTFRVARGPAGNGGSPWYTGVDVEFWPSPNARQNYQEILLVQFVRSRYGLEGKTRGWHLDNGAGWKFWGPIPYWGRPKWFQKPPYYVNQAPMQHGPKGLAFAHAWDNPGRNGTNVSEEEWKDYAVGIGYNGSVHSLGYVNYGIDYYDSATDSPTNAITYWIAGGGFSTGTDGQTPGVNAIGIQPSPGGVAP